jgi:phosphatidate cytidylyltransferase
MARYDKLLTRVLVALVAIPLILWLTMRGGYSFFALVALISALSLYEYYRLAEAKGVFPQKMLGLAAGFAVNGVFVFERFQVDAYSFFAALGIRLPLFSLHQVLTAVLLIFLLSVALVELFRIKGSPLLNVAVTVAGVLIISLCFGTLIFLRELFPYGFPMSRFFPPEIGYSVKLAQIDRWGGYTVISLLAAIWLCDTAAYFGGASLGRHRLFERVSPKKTWEGAIFGFVFAVVTMIGAKYLVLTYLALQHAIALGVFVGVFGQLGDLIESRFKRDAGVKDSSALIPGHGGAYDRFDSLVYLSPIVYLYIDYVVFS